MKYYIFIATTIFMLADNRTVTERPAYICGK